MKTSNQSGSHVIAIALFLLFAGVVSFAGYRVWQMQQPAADTSAATASSSSVPAAITSAATLNQAGSVLDSSSAQLDTNLDDSALNADLNSML